MIYITRRKGVKELPYFVHLENKKKEKRRKTAGK